MSNNVIHTNACFLKVSTYAKRNLERQMRIYLMKVVLFQIYYTHYFKFRIKSMKQYSSHINWVVM